MLGDCRCGDPFHTLMLQDLLRSVGVRCVVCGGGGPRLEVSTLALCGQGHGFSSQQQEKNTAFLKCINKYSS